MDPRWKALAALGACVCLAACDSDGVNHGRWDGWRRVENAYADRFQLWKKGEERLVLVFGHGGERDTVGAYLLAGGAEDVPPPVQANRLEGPIGSIAAGSTTHVPFICALGCERTITACVHMGQVRIPAFLEHVRHSPVKEIATADGLDREALAVLKPEVLFGYPFGRGEGRALEGLGITTIEVSEYLEEHPLGRAEWLRFFGAFFRQERKADSLFAGIRERYERLRVDTSGTDRPTVLFGSVWNGQWWVPPGNSYMARLIADAGGRYVFADRKGDGNIAVDMETMITVGSRADHWGMIAQITDGATEEDFTHGDARLEMFRSVREHHLFLGNTLKEDLFGQALLEPDIVLGSLREVLRPGNRTLLSFRPEYFGDMFLVSPAPHIQP